MRKILLLVEHGLLSQLYKTNLTVYLESQVVLCSNYNQFCLQIPNINDYLMVISLANFDNEKMVDEFRELIRSQKIQIPILLIGDGSESEGLIKFVPEFLNIQNILGQAAKQLKITAQMMAAYVVPEFYPIDIEFIYYLKKAPTSLYIEISGEYVMFATKGTTIDEVVQGLKDEGVEKFYIKSNERLEIVAKITETLKEELSKSSHLSIQYKSEIVASGFDYFIDHYVSPEASSSISNLAKDCSKVMSEVVSESPDLQSMFLMFRNNKNNFLYIHSMLGSYVASHIIRNVSWGNESHVDKVIYVFFFHDLYLAPIYAKYPHLMSEEDLQNSMELSRQEKHTLANHARYAAELVAGLKKSPIGSDQLIRQHHGMNTGIGFAQEYKEDISPLAKIIIISESFVEMFIQQKGQNPNQPIDIIEIIQRLNEKFKLNSYKKIIETLVTLNI